AETMVPIATHRCPPRAARHVYVCPNASISSTQSSVPALAVAGSATTSGGWNNSWVTLPWVHRSMLVFVARIPRYSPFVTAMFTGNDWILYVSPEVTLEV